MIPPLVIALLFAFLLASMTSASGALAPGARVEYTIELDKPQTQTVTITMIVRGWKGDTLDVHLPVWRPGRYEVLDPAGTIREFSVLSGSSQKLAFEKVNKSSWRIQTANASVIRVRYTIYANAISNRTRHVDDTHAYLSGSTVFLYVHELRDQPVEITVKAPANWKVATGLEPAPSVPNVFTAADYDTLVDSPFEIGLHETYTYTVDGVPHEIVIWGTQPDDPDKLTSDFAKITKVQKDLFGSFPYSRYVFLTHIAPDLGGGTEHLNSTIIQARPQIYDESDRYDRFMGLVSHELFHTWNVKQFRPHGIKPYDYQLENYTTLLWLAEGTTTYYDSLMVARAGVISADTYLKGLADTFKGELTRPGRARQSLEDSSFDAWIKFNKTTPDSINSTVSFYSRGELINFVLDARIRNLTNGTKSLDDLMRALYEKFPASAGPYATQDVLSILQSITGTDFTDFHARHIAGTEDPDVDAALADFGLLLIRAPKPTEDDPGTGETSYLGIEFKDADTKLSITSVREDGPAYLAGLNVDDTIAAINGQAMNSEDLEAMLEAGSTDPIAFEIKRRGRTLTINVTPELRSTSDWSIERMQDPSPAQRQAYEAWLHSDWPSGDEPAEVVAPPAPLKRPSRF
jgi:predicted metalloprotease with PDZ domain